MLHQNVVKSSFIVTLRRPDGTIVHHRIQAESLAAAKLCAKSIAEQERAKSVRVAMQEQPETEERLCSRSEL